MSKSNPLFILVAGPYRSNTGDDRGKIDANLEAMTRAALDVFRLGHLPVLGESLALPLIRQAGSRQIGDSAFQDIFHPISRMLAERVDAVLRVGGPSKGADEMVEIARRDGKLVFGDLAEISAIETRATSNAK
jgi:DNA-binding cell septation regulator SpoVG